MLDLIPADIILLIAEHIRDRRDLNHLSQGSRSLHDCITPELYKSITFTSDEYDIPNLGIDVFLEHSAQYLHWVKNVEVSAPIHRHVRARCPQDDIIDDYEPSDDDSESESDCEDQEAESIYCSSSLAEPVTYEFAASENEVYDFSVENRGRTSTREPRHEEFLTALESQVLPLLTRIPDGRLASFSWNLGTCIPRSVAEHLCITQPQLKSLSIINDATCSDLSVPPLDNNLDGLSHLRRVVFVPKHLEAEDALRQILRQNAHTLEEMSFHRSKYLCDGYKLQHGVEKKYPTHDFLTLEPSLAGGCLSFPSLKKLALTLVSFTSVHDMISALNFSQLRSLTLRDCFGMDKLFEALTHSPSMRLTSLAVTVTGTEFEHGEIYLPLMRFLCSFSGLEDLFLLNGSKEATSEDFQLSIGHHQSTLRRLVYQQTSIFMFDESDEPHDELFTLWQEKPIECLGVGCGIQKLHSSLQDISPRPKIRFLHIRPTTWLTWATLTHRNSKRADRAFRKAMPSALEFAQWVFGPDGIPELRTLAYGDFAYGGRQPSIAWCRESTGFGYYEVTRKHAREWEYIQSNLDFLEVCPQDSLFHTLGV